MNTWQLFLIPLSSAFSCWLVTRLIFTFLFHPLRPRSFAGLTIQGILPAKQSALAASVGKYVASEFFSMKTIGEKINDPSNLQKIMPAIEAHIDDFLRNKLKKEMPIIGMFIGDKTIDSLKKVFITELEILFPQVMSSYASNLAHDLNIEELVTHKIAAVSVNEIEMMFYQNFSRELRLTGVFASFIGLIIGIITMVIIIYIK